jgi:hypothetical protein
MPAPQHRDPDAIARARPYGPNFWRVYRAYGRSTQTLIGYVKRTVVAHRALFTPLDLKRMQVGTHVYTLRAATRRLEEHKARNERHK